jgi:hypothetical protein
MSPFALPLLLSHHRRILVVDVHLVEKTVVDLQDRPDIEGRKRPLTYSSLKRRLIYMATTSDHSVTPESNDNTCVRPRKRRTWLPILGGVLCGMIALCLFSTHEPPFFYHFTAWAINETPPVKMIEPRSVHFTLFMLTLAAIGGSIGVLFSQWRKRIAFLFLLAILTVITVFAGLGNYLESSVWHR